MMGQKGSSATFDDLFSLSTGVNKQQQYFQRIERHVSNSVNTDDSNKGGRSDICTNQKLRFSSFVVTSDSSEGLWPSRDTAAWL